LIYLSLCFYFLFQQIFTVGNSFVLFYCLCLVEFPVLVKLLLEAMVILGDEARSIDSVLYMEPLFKVGDIMCLKEKQSQELDPFRLACVL